MAVGEAQKTAPLEYPVSILGEEIPMTFQVGLIGIDGFVLASDTQLSQVGGEQQFRFSSTTTKISFNSEKGMAWCITGDRSVVLAEHKFSGLLRNANGDFDEIPDLLRKASKEAWRESFNGASVTRDRIGYQRRLTVVKSDGKKHLGWMLDMFETPDCQSFRDKTISGDAANLASFFVECFYSYGSPHRSVEQLKSLAATTIVFGGRLNPTGVAGLEMVVCSDGKLTKVDEAELVDLESRSLHLHSAIQRDLFPESSSARSHT